MDEEPNRGGRPASYTEEQILGIVTELRCRNPTLPVTTGMVAKALKEQGVGSINASSLKLAVMEAVATYDAKVLDELVLSISDDDRKSVRELMDDFERGVLGIIGLHSRNARNSVLERIRSLEKRLLESEENNAGLEVTLSDERRQCENLRGLLASAEGTTSVLRQQVGDAHIMISRLEAKIEVYESQHIRELRARSDRSEDAALPLTADVATE